MKERPIIFSAPMIRALLEGRKTQTRRLLKDPVRMTGGDMPIPSRPCPYGVPGDRLWVRETCDYFAGDKSVAPERRIIYYRERDDFPAATGKWCPPIFMPRWASRITLEVEEVRVERLHDIKVGGYLTRSDVQLEGCPFENDPALMGDDEVAWYRELWNSLNAKRAPWELNPWVWVIAFRRLP